MKARYYGIRLGAVLLITLDTLRRVFHDTKPIDWVMLVVEVLVLLLIFGEIAYHIVRHFKVRHRLKRTGQKLVDGQKLQSDGQKLGTDAAAQQKIDTWIKQVTDWIDTTNDLLKGYSLEASIAFLRDPGASFNPFVADTMTPAAKTTYLRLQYCLNNLHAVRENVDTYL